MFALRTVILAMLAASAAAQAQTPAASSAPAAAPTKTAAPNSNQSTRQSAKPAHPATAASMDLHAPPLSHIYPRQDLQYILAYDPDADTEGEVSVKGAKAVVNVPVSPGNQLQALPWALFHPTEAWRILTPIESP